jgi:hypothetical protein
MSNYFVEKIENNGSTENFGHELLQEDNNNPEAIRTYIIDFFIY